MIKVHGMKPGANGEMVLVTPTNQIITGQRVADRIFALITKIADNAKLPAHHENAMRLLAQAETHTQAEYWVGKELWRDDSIIAQLMSEIGMGTK